MKKSTAAILIIIVSILSFIIGKYAKSAPDVETAEGFIPQSKNVQTVDDMLEEYQNSIGK